MGDVFKVVFVNGVVIFKWVKDGVWIDVKVLVIDYFDLVVCYIVIMLGLCWFLLVCNIVIVERSVIC